MGAYCTSSEPPPGGWWWCYVLPADPNWRSPSGLVRPMFLNPRQAQQKASIMARYSNAACSCADLGCPTPSDADFVDHSMFCQIHKCYAYEVGCCDGRVISVDENGDMQHCWDCNCVEYAFPPGIPELPDRVWNERRHVRGRRGDIGWPECPGGRSLVCSCCDAPGGPYVPLCPFRRHAGTGLCRGDLYASLRRMWNARAANTGDFEWDEPPVQP